MTGESWRGDSTQSAVMTGLVPVTHVVKLLEILEPAGSIPAWMAGTSPSTTEIAA
jgi:hypothetical protein